MFGMVEIEDRAVATASVQTKPGWCAGIEEDRAVETASTQTKPASAG